MLGEGVFETIRIEKNHPFFIDGHFNRLLHGLNFLEIPFHETVADISDAIQFLLKENNCDLIDCCLRLTVTRGNGGRGLVFSDPIPPTVIFSLSPLPSQKDGVRLGISPFIRNEQSPLTKIKSTNYLENIIARREVIKRGFDDAVWLNTKNYISETTAANIFFIHEDEIITPRIDDGALPGILREKIIFLLDKNAFTVSEEPCTVEKALLSEEVFLTNSLIEIQKVQAIGNHVYKECGQVDKIKELFHDAKSAQLCF